jgi:hypothetical protein
MSQIIERFMRHQVTRGFKNLSVFDKAINLYTALKAENEDQTLYDVFVAEYKSR